MFSGPLRQNCTHHTAMRNRMGGEAIWSSLGDYSLPPFPPRHMVANCNNPTLLITAYPIFTRLQFTTIFTTCVEHGIVYLRHVGGWSHWLACFCHLLVFVPAAPPPGVRSLSRALLKLAPMEHN